MKTFSLLFFFVLCCESQIKFVGGNFTGAPDEWNTKLSPQTRRWADSVLATFDSSRLVDIHIHIAGSGNSGSGIWLNRNLTEGSLLQRLKFQIYLSASKVSSVQKADEEYLQRLRSLIAHHRAQKNFHIFAFDAYYRKNGTIDSSRTEFHVPNSYVWEIAQSDSRFVPVISIHPYRKDALKELDAWGNRGIKFIKWLPNAMGIDPADSSLISFYEKLKEYNITLITHAGEEKAVEAEEDQKLGNPLRLRLPLNLGVKIIVAHCAGLGTNEDYESASRPTVSSFQLFSRLMNDSRYNENLFGDISATTFFNRNIEALETLLEKEEWHPRLVYGSDYPLPGINALIIISSFVSGGFIKEKEGKYLKEIYGINPLLFDLLLKRIVKHPKTKRRFQESVFYLPQQLN